MDHPCDHYHGDPTLTKLMAILDDRPEALSAVKCASFDPETADHLPNSAFAWEEQRRYPMHTREDVIASIAYRTKFAGAVPRVVDQRLSLAAEAFGVRPDMFRAQTVKQASAETTIPYALPQHGRLPLGDRSQIKVAAEVLHRDGATLPLAERVEAYVKVAAALTAHGMAVDPDVGCYAGLNSCNTQMLRDRIGMRAATTKVAALVNAYDTLDNAFAHMPPVIHDRPTLLKLASRIEELDRAADIQEHYGRKIFDPMKTVFNSGEKLAAPMGDNTARLMALPPHVWQQVDVPEMAAIVESGDEAQFRQIYATLPLDVKMQLEGQL